MSGRNYCVYDVFSAHALAGNQLAVVFDCDGLDTARMQAIAREFSLSETVFVLPPADPRNEAHIRIFLPTRELPFAGHPTVGAAVASAQLRHGGGSHGFVLEEAVGEVSCRVEIGEEAARAEFDLPRLPQRIDVSIDTAQLAGALSIPESQLGFDRHVVSVWSAGVPYVLAPVKTRAAVSAAKAESETFLSLLHLPGAVPAAPYIYCAGGDHESSNFHARMLAPWDGIPEDPATGSAAAAMAGALVSFEQLAKGVHCRRIEQGVEMGRASFIDLTLTMGQNALSKVSIGGHAVKVAEGRLFA